jgi:hypothetical protein
MKIITASAIAVAISAILAGPVLAQNAADTPSTTESGPAPLESSNGLRGAYGESYAYAGPDGRAISEAPGRASARLWRHREDASR